ncbi:MAG: hypothetical protein A2084_00905 [Tenericutes bacterium GWC2_39_45]|nr:MAG: hypothetical protein A2Y43_00945 [Tenericutes bacterium GWA2_38_26]OHE30364.1 MAG: hypothetical protein A2084_00905 [Tenericutes bacterium GWC2_39_45]OHE41161.1 MAG: hypothetical protein A2102_01220 [Tenericutes bacterium GWF2_38_8]
MTKCIKIIFGKTYDNQNMMFTILEFFKNEVQTYRIASGDLSAYFYSNNEYTPLFEKEIFRFDELLEKRMKFFVIQFATILAFPSNETIDIWEENQLINSSCVYGITIVDVNEYYVFSRSEKIISRIEALCDSLSDIEYEVGDLTGLNILQEPIMKD